MLDPDVRRVLDGTSIAHLATILPDGSPDTVPPVGGQGPWISCARSAPVGEISGRMPSVSVRGLPGAVGRAGFHQIPGISRRLRAA
jgi:hypothetical protein